MTFARALVRSSLACYPFDKARLLCGCVIRKSFLQGRAQGEARGLCPRVLHDWSLATCLLSLVPLGVEQ
ncbi:MAG TPA: hypothetical protein VJB10_04230 [Candidatus Peribacteraceae bacterium]|nr:hypothetical protein [Candidatus Peribacteraceae bacterium]